MWKVYVGSAGITTKVFAPGDGEYIIQFAIKVSYLILV